MTKKELIELVQESINSGSTVPDIWKKAHPLVVSKYISMAFNTLFYTIFKLNPEELNTYGKWYYDQDVKQDSNGYYSDLPCSKVQLPNSTSSIKRIELPNDKYSTIFLPLQSLAVSTMSSLGTVNRSGVITYSVSTKITYNETMSTYPKVSVFAIVPFEDIEENDEITIPLGQDVNLIKMVLEFFNSNVPTDNITNNS